MSVGDTHILPASQNTSLRAVQCLDAVSNRRAKYWSTFSKLSGLPEYSGNNKLKGDARNLAGVTLSSFVNSTMKFVAEKRSDCTSESQRANCTIILFDAGSSMST